MKRIPLPALHLKESVCTHVHMPSFVCIAMALHVCLYGSTSKAAFSKFLLFHLLLLLVCMHVCECVCVRVCVCVSVCVGEQCLL